jgi:dTDP-4-dehydrorhamnose reductase
MGDDVPLPLAYWVRDEDVAGRHQSLQIFKASTLHALLSQRRNTRSVNSLNLTATAWRVQERSARSWAASPNRSAKPGSVHNRLIVAPRWISSSSESFLCHGRVTITNGIRSASQARAIGMKRRFGDPSETTYGSDRTKIDNAVFCAFSVLVGANHNCTRSQSYDLAVSSSQPAAIALMKILITGPDGQIGHELMRALSPRHEVLGLARAQMDLAQPASIQRAIRAAAPDLIINAAGYTAVDRAEREPDLARMVNATAVGVIGEEAAAIGAAVIHYSTDYIFDGAKLTPYTPDDRPNPLNVYGHTKWQGELALARSGAHFIILRTAWVYGLRSRNFLLRVLELANERSELRIVDDQIGCPTWCRSIALATERIINCSLAGPAGARTFGGREGVYHLASAGATSWFGFAQRIFNLARLPRTPVVLPISSREYGAPAKRPAFSVLDCSGAKECFDVFIPHWDSVLQEVMNERG